MLIALFFHFWMVLATVLIVSADASTTVAVLGMLLISFLILSLISYHIYINILNNSNFNNNGRIKKNDYVFKKSNKRTISTDIKRSKNKRR